MCCRIISCPPILSLSLSLRSCSRNIGAPVETVHVIVTKSPLGGVGAVSSVVHLTMICICIVPSLRSSLLGIHSPVRYICIYIMCIQIVVCYNNMCRIAR